MAEGAEALLRAILALLIDEREARQPDEHRERTEVILANAGFGATEIAALTGKNPASIRVTLSRARRTRKKAAADG